MESLRQFRTLSFDCYGTLIDWESGIWSQLQPWLTTVAPRHQAVSQYDRESILAQFGALESAVEDKSPDALYPQILTEVHHQLADRLEIERDSDAAQKFAASVGEWPPFTDTAKALKRLSRRYRLVILSNIDRNSFSHSALQIGVEFDAVHTAQDIGSYKPDHRNFEYLLRRETELGIFPEQILHVAQSLYHDHVPAQASGLATCWIDRRDGQIGGATPTPEQPVQPHWRFSSMSDFAAAVDNAFDLQS